MVGIPGPPYRNSLMGNLCSIFWSLTMIVFPPHQTLTLSPWATMPGSIVRILGTTSRASFFTHPPLYPQHLSFTTYSHFISSPHSFRSTPIISKLPASLIFTHILPRLWSSVSNSQIIKKKLENASKNRLGVSLCNAMCPKALSGRVGRDLFNRDEGRRPTWLLEAFFQLWDSAVSWLDRMKDGTLAFPH